jgi:GH25 family lysozyme M1 (1,4-beta-N-acetylmuramidase)
MAFTWPVNAPVTQTFASNPSSIQPNGHTGIDFGVNVGTPVLATGPGIVVFEGWATQLSANNQWWIAPAYAGICVVIDHGNGLLSLYGHLSETYISVGDRVSQGQAFAASGNTGLSSGPHLHFELLGWPLQPYNGFYGRINPNLYVSGNWTGTINPAGNITPVPKAANERLAGGSNVNQRSAANTTAEITRVIAANTLEVFEGFVIGENFEGIDTWYKDVHGYCWAGGFTNSSRDGLPNLTPIVLRPDQRKCGPDNVNQRSEPNTSAPVVRVIAANTLEEFTGFVYGENFAGINVWYKDANGYAWAGGFTDSSTNGLPDVTPKVVAVNERIVGTSQVNQRKLPNTSSDIVRVIDAGTKEVFTHYTIGQKIEEIDLWYKDADGYVWAGGFTEQKTDGLERFDMPIVPEPEKPVDPVKPDEPVDIIGLSGIDISNHQKGIDLLNIEADFFIIKSSEGIGWTDPEFAVNVQKVRDTGMLVGFYHFARPVPDNTAKAEAESFLKIIKPYVQVGDLLVLDWEAENQQNTAWAEEWLDIVAKATNSNPLIYMNLSCANQYNWTSVKSKYKLWLAQYPTTAKQGYGPAIAEHGKVPGWSVAMWQYTSAGRLDNWAGDLDLNVFYGTPVDWDSLGVKDAVIDEPTDPVKPDEPTDPVKPPVDTEKAKLMALLEKAVDEYLK